MDFWENFGEVVWWFLWIFAFTAYLVILFQIIGDLFRDHELSGWWKAVWVFFLIFVPFLTALTYLIARGKGMAQRNVRAMETAQRETEAYIKDVAGSSPSDEISKARALLEAGHITQSEYEALKARALHGGHPIQDGMPRGGTVPPRETAPPTGPTTY
ncbi:SHOCT domain-containing protein [Georgenia sp. SUBG003]|uniref:SHOCT domain-containing protein n=1 Tax=Georgenia sp. SUBG003 TaxID=1497974 RepID=UPI003AB134A5